MLTCIVSNTRCEWVRVSAVCFINNDIGANNSTQMSLEEERSRGKRTRCSRHSVLFSSLAFYKPQITFPLWHFQIAPFLSAQNYSNDTWVNVEISQSFPVRDKDLANASSSQPCFPFKQTSGLYINIINPEEDEDDQMKHEGQWTRWWENMNCHAIPTAITVTD